MSSPLGRLITEVSEEAWSSAHLNIFSGHLLDGCPSSGAFCSLAHAGGRSRQQPPLVLYELALKINYTAEVGGGDPRGDKGRSISVRAGGWPRSAVGKCSDSGIYHRGGRSINTRSGC